MLLHGILDIMESKEITLEGLARRRKALLKRKFIGLLEGSTYREQM